MQESQDYNPEVTWRHYRKIEIFDLWLGKNEEEKMVACILKNKKILISKIRHQLSDCKTKALSPTDLDMSLSEYAQQEVIR